MNSRRAISFTYFLCAPVFIGAFFLEIQIEKAEQEVLRKNLEPSFWFTAAANVTNMRP